MQDILCLAGREGHIVKAHHPRTRPGWNGCYYSLISMRASLEVALFVQFCHEDDGGVILRRRRLVLLEQPCQRFTKAPAHIQLLRALEQRPDFPAAPHDTTVIAQL